MQAVQDGGDTAETPEVMPSMVWTEWFFVDLTEKIIDIKETE